MPQVLSDTHSKLEHARDERMTEVLTSLVQTEETELGSYAERYEEE
jgi:hypothetical protein